MKLHVIEVENLASLYGKQRVDLDADLRGATLFLVQGPTGSGKSTLMDGVSLALFGTTPRLGAKAKGMEVGEALIARGTGEARVSVVFSTIAEGGRRTWKATWKAWRAHRRPDGDVQKPERGLERRGQDGAWEQVVSSNLEKVYAPHFSAALEGFNVDDFCRSMLLAQGQFDAFLRAKEDERANILERLTNTSDYARLGLRAAKLGKAWRRRLERLTASRDATGGVAAEVEAVARSELAAHTLRFEDAERDIGRLDAALRWWEGRERLRAGVAEAEQEGAAVGRAEADAAEALGALGAHEANAALFALSDAAAREHANAHRLDGERAQAREALPGHEQAATLALQRARASEIVLEHAERGLEALREPVAEALACDRSLSAAQGEAQRAGAEARSATAKAEDARKTAAKMEETRASAHAERLARWSDVEADGLGAQITEAIPRLRELAVMERERTKSHATRAEQHHREADNLAAAAAALQGALRDLDARSLPTLAEPEEALSEARRALAVLLRGSPDVEGRRAVLRLQEADATDVRDRLADVVPAVQRRDEQAGRLREARAAAEQAERDVPPLTADQERLKVEATTARAVATAQRDSLERAELAANLAVHRHTLVTGEPCPLCGSPEHPVVEDAEVARQDAAAHAALASMRADAAGAEGHAREAERRAAEAAGRVGAAERERERTAAAAEDALARLRGATDLAAGLVARTAPHVPDLPGGAGITAESIQGALRDATAALGTFQTARRGLDLADAHQRSAEATFLKVTEVLAADRRVLDTQVSALNGRRDAHRADAAAVRRLEIEAGEAQVALSAAIQTFFPGAATSEEAGMGAIELRFEAHRALGAALEAADNRLLLTRADGQRAGDEARRAEELEIQRRAEATERVAAASEAGRARDIAAVRLARVWTEVLTRDAEQVPPERPAAEAAPTRLLQSQERRVGEARARSLEAQDSLKLAENERHTVATRLSELTRLHDAAVARAAESEGALTAAATAGADVTALIALRLPEARVSELRALRSALVARRAAVLAVVEERRSALADHEAARDLSLLEETPEILAERRIQREGDRAMAAGAREQALLTIRQAEDGRAARAAADERLATATRQARVWLELHSLIGTGDGRAFRTYAQSLNLGQVLVRANDHLSRLCARYVLLGRVQDGSPTLDLLVADNCHVGAPRELRTLSGGETFLVSLALALGLSDLRTVRLPIETLLLDEGFGSLDTETLETALNALRQLEATGRQVGVISHVLALQDGIPARVHIVPVGSGRSEVRVDRV